MTTGLSRRIWGRAVLVGVMVFAVGLGAMAQGVTGVHVRSDGTRIPIDPRDDTGLLRRDTSIPPTRVLRATNIDFNITYNDVVNNRNVGFDDPTEGAARRARVDEVLVYLDSVLNESGALDIFFDNSETDGTGALAFAGTNFWYMEGEGSFTNGQAYEHILDAGYTPPLSGYSDIDATFDFGWSWYSGTGTPGAGEFDLISVLLHELTHGLGFLSLIDHTDGTGMGGTHPDTYARYDQLLRTGNGNVLVNSSAMWIGNLNYLLGADNGLVTVGTNSVTAFGGTNPPIYAPDTWQSGSSVSHWDSEISGGAVMEPSINYGTEKRTYAAIDIALLKDIGYSNAAAPAGTLPPVPDFTADVTTGTAPLTVQFTDQSTNTPTSWAWDFDNNGSTDSTLENPEYTYSDPGTYTVKLTATNEFGSGNETKADYITVTAAGSAPVADFAADVTTGTAPLTVNFTDLSTESPTSWAWNFNGNMVIDSTIQNPSFVYDVPGTYTVSLTATNDFGADEVIKTDHITVNAPPDVLAIQASGNPGQAEAGGVFALSLAGGSSWNWQKYDDIAGMWQSVTDSGSVTGQGTDTLTFDPLTMDDSGQYRCQYDDGTKKALRTTDPITLTVLPEGALPVGGPWAFGLFGTICLAAVAMMLRRVRARQEQ